MTVDRTTAAPVAAVVYAPSTASAARSVIASLNLLEVQVKRIDVGMIPAPALESGLPSSRVAEAVAKLADADFVIVLAGDEKASRARVEAFLSLVPDGALAGKGVLPLSDSGPSDERDMQDFLESTCVEQLAPELRLAC